MIIPLIFVLLLGREVLLQPDGNLHAYFFDIGQGDAALLVSPSGKQIVIDGGPDLSLLQHLGRTMPFLDRRIELLVLSHPNLDHLAAFPEILERYQVERVLLAGSEFPLPRYDAIIAKIEEQGISVIIADPEKDIDLGDGLLLDIAWPPVGFVPPDDINDASIVMRALYKDHAILFTGDIEELGENLLLQTGAEIDSDIIKVPHHGSKTSSSTGFLLAVTPDLAVISASRENSYGHPHPEVVERYRHFGILVRITAEEGTVHLELP